MNEDSHFGLIKKAVVLARKFHAGQVRKGPTGEAFYNHPRRVCKCYLAFKHKTVAGMVASLCHDLVEDTSLSIDQIETVFGAQVRQIVSDLTKPYSFSSDDYAARIGNWSLESRKIKLCDIEDNILSSRQIPSERRSRMLFKWKKYLNQLENASGEGQVEEEEFIQKWDAVNRLYAREQQGLTTD